mmetsp:Transcript_82843/g.238007  ORF Transcript_82843/g.238007 Transcript_82843/m.238007 type:complete len:215 (-) Transcript_82843:608-1252(-)
MRHCRQLRGLQVAPLARRIAEAGHLQGQDDVPGLAVRHDLGGAHVHGGPEGCAGHEHLLCDEGHSGRAAERRHEDGANGLKLRGVVPHVHDGGQVPPEAREVHQLELVVAQDFWREHVHISGHHSKDHEQHRDEAHDPKEAGEDVTLEGPKRNGTVDQAEEQRDASHSHVDAPGRFAAHPHDPVQAALGQREEQGQGQRGAGGDAQRQRQDRIS